MVPLKKKKESELVKNGERRTLAARLLAFFITFTLLVFLSFLPLVPFTCSPLHRSRNRQPRLLTGFNLHAAPFPSETLSL